MRNKWFNITLLVLMTVATMIFFVFGIKVVQIIILLGGWTAVIAKISKDLKSEKDKSV
jgi:hypothetical protein